MRLLGTAGCIAINHWRIYIGFCSSCYIAGTVSWCLRGKSNVIMVDYSLLQAKVKYIDPFLRYHLSYVSSSPLVQLHNFKAHLFIFRADRLEFKKLSICELGRISE